MASMAELGRPLRILVRSDSQGTSLGEGTVDPHHERLWAACLRRRLTERGIDVEVRNASAAGLKIGKGLQFQRTDPLVQEANAWADVVVLGLGMNDWWPIARPQWLADWMDRARPLLLRRVLRQAYKKVRHRLLEVTKGRIRPTKPDDARRALTEMVRELEVQGRGVVLVTPFPVRSPVNPLLDGNTYEASDVVVEVGEACGVPAVDCRTLFLPISWETISIDHIHVNPEGHEVIATAVADALPLPDLRGSGRAPDDVCTVAEGAVLVRGDALVAGELARAGADASDRVDAWRVALVDGFSVHDELWRVQHDPLVREAVGGARAVVMAPGERSRPTAWDRERLEQLVDIVRRRTHLVLVDDGGPWSAAIREVAARQRVAVAALSSPHDVRDAVSLRDHA